MCVLVSVLVLPYVALDMGPDLSSRIALSIFGRKRERRA